MKNKVIKGFKGFDKNMKCRDKQYKENTVFEEDIEPKACKIGMHFCENPIDVLGYYGFEDDNQFCEVEGSGKVCKKEDKVSVSKIKVKAKIGISGLVNASVGFILNKVKKESASTNTGNRSASTNTGDESASTNTGYRSASTVEGQDSVALNIGIKGKSKACKGSYIVIGNWIYKDNWILEEVYKAKTGKDKIKDVLIKPDLFYWFEDGKLNFDK